jgi:fatty-acid desaturase
LQAFRPAASRRRLLLILLRQRLCHVRGYRTFDNTATNIPWLALLTGGEGFHNNHHSFPRSPKFSARSGEIDPSWPTIQLLTRLKLARPDQTIEEISEGRRARPSARPPVKDGRSVSI